MSGSYARTPAQLANIAEQKRTGGFGSRVVMPKSAPPKESWWTCPDVEFSMKHAREVPRMTAQTTTFRHHCDEGF